MLCILRATPENKRYLIVVKIVGILFFFLFVSLSFKENLDVADRGKRDAETKAGDKKYMEFDDFVNGKFDAKSFYPHWVSGEEYVYQRDDGSFGKTDIESGLRDEDILPADVWNSFPNQMSWSLSADQMFMAIQFNQTDGYAHYMRTFTMAFINMTSKQITNTITLAIRACTKTLIRPTDIVIHASIILCPNREVVKSADFPEDKIQKFKWAPVGHAFSYVFGFDVYIAEDLMTSPMRVTQNGDELVTFNGISDWMLWLEITDDDVLMWWSPNGKYLAFATMDESEVTKAEFSFFGNLQYPKTIRYPYSKVGTPAPKTHLTVVDVMQGNMTRLEPHDHVQTWEDYYLNSAIWINDNIFVPTWKNRLQNESISDNCVAPNFTCSHFSIMKDSISTGWVGNYKEAHIFPSNNESEYFTVRSNGVFFHLARMDIGAGAIDWRTNGSFEVTDTNLGYQSIHNYDPLFDWIYYTSTEMANSTGEGLPRIRHLWRTKAHGDDMTRSCITCELNQVFTDRCNWVSPSFSKYGSYLVVNCGGTGNGVPLSTVHKINPSGDYEFVRIAENNTELQNTLAEYYFRDRVYGTIELPGVQGDWYYTMHKPPNFDPTRKYPMLVYVYSGPGEQEASDRWLIDWSRGYVASSNLDVIVMTFDGRGTGFRGIKILHMVYRKLGHYEPLDQIEAARQISTKFDYIDSSRIAIWGRSYGGYVTARAISEDVDQVLKCGFAVAPVADWTFYSSHYTERYMGFPTGDNEEGYANSTTLQKLENYGKHYFVLVHGTSDENVHIQHSARLSKELIAADIDFSNYFAGDEWHGFNRLPNSYAHHYKLLTHHLEICFDI